MTLTGSNLCLQILLEAPIQVTFNSAYVLRQRTPMCTVTDDLAHYTTHASTYSAVNSRADPRMQASFSYYYADCTLLYAIDMYQLPQILVLEEAE